MIISGLSGSLLQHLSHTLGGSCLLRYYLTLNQTAIWHVEEVIKLNSAYKTTQILDSCEFFDNLGATFLKIMLG